MVVLKDPNGRKQFPRPIHIDRLKPAYVRQPTPSDYFNVTTKQTFSIQSTQTEDKCFQPISALEHNQTSSHDDSSPNEITMRVTSPVTRPKRATKRPHKLRGSDHIDPVELLSSCDERKIKRVLAQRHTSDGLQYLVQLVGEPAQNAMWLTSLELNRKAKASIKHRPPPLV